MASSRNPRRDLNRYRIELTMGSFLFWTCSLLVLLGWIFILGIMVGRGDVPQVLRAFIPEQKPGVSLVPDVPPHEESAPLTALQGAGQDPELKFYEELASKKAQVARKGQPAGARGPAAVPPPAGGLPPAGVVPPAESPGYVVQVASVDTESGAGEMVRSLSQRGYQAYFTKASVKGRIYYRIRCGPYKARDEAVRVMGEIASKEGLDGFLMEVGP